MMGYNSVIDDDDDGGGGGSAVVRARAACLFTVLRPIHTHSLIQTHNNDAE